MVRVAELAVLVEDAPVDQGRHIDPRVVDDFAALKDRVKAVDTGGRSSLESGRPTGPLTWPSWSHLVRIAPHVAKVPAAQEFITPPWKVMYLFSRAPLLMWPPNSARPTG